MEEKRSRYLAVLVIALLALFLRWRAVLMLPTDYDEPVYLDAAAQYASAIKAGDWPRLISNRHTIEHPPLVKLLYAAGILLRGDGRTGLTTARVISAAFGVLQVALLTLLNPLAGFFLAIHTMTIKYTSQAYLEALPAFASLVALVAYEKSAQEKNQPNCWLVLSATALGVTAASKYTYLIVGLAIAPFLIWRNRHRLWIVTLFLGIALFTFFVLDVQVWADPLGRLRDSLLFHPAYAQSQQVQRIGRPWWQPLYYLSHSIPWHPGVFFLSWDTAIFALSVLGIPFLYRRHPAALLWLLLGIVILLLWTIKWPQYTLIVVAPLCLSAGTLIHIGIEWLDQHTTVLRAVRTFLPDPATWLFIAIVTLVGLVGFSYVQWQYTQQMQGWTVYVTRNSNLPSDSVRALAIDTDGHVWAGTERGAAFLKDGQWSVYNTANSGLINDSVRAIAIDSTGRVWFGTDGGVSVLDGMEWRGYDTQNSGLINDHVLCIASMPASFQPGNPTETIWFGTESGLSRFDGTTWTNYTPADSGLAGARVLAIAMDGQRRIWIGTWGGLCVFDGSVWTSYTSHNSGLIFDTVSSLVVDNEGKIWCGTLDGISVFDGDHIWTNYSIATMSLSFNTATAMTLDRQGRIWVGADLPVGPLGAAAMFDGQKWHDYSFYFSRQRQAPVRAIAVDPEGRIWFATLLEGIHVYEGLTK